MDILIETGNIKSAKVLDNKRKTYESHAVQLNTKESEHKNKMEVTKDQTIISRINAVSQNKKQVKQETLEPEPNQPTIERKDTGELQEILKIKVTKATEYFIDPERIYEIKSNFRGLALIVNNEEFSFKDEFPTRTGSQVDVANLRDLFQQLGFDVVVLQNSTRLQTLNQVIDFSIHQGHASADMMVFCMATHGDEKGKLMSSDCLEIDIEKDIVR